MKICTRTHNILLKCTQKYFKTKELLNEPESEESIRLRNKTINISSDFRRNQIQGQLYNLDTDSTDEQANNHLSISLTYKNSLHLHCLHQDLLPILRTRGCQKPLQGLRNVSCRKILYGLFLLYLLRCTNLWISDKNFLLM